ncbi:GyrI-like domain-containing protein [Eubacterium aggregans]|uniref:GyrI-like domain-containing protein n=1 Tax=Eubacterium aggregans TaxID=81409 RepID=UPI0023F0C8FD|nr:GyrI-like domain-containing protein [Eubacterium aggregans]MDD4692194.1 GyrI-like domain-containing protein [Eubacterium aggregans]
MDYELVSLEEKIVVGLSATTGNNDPKMGEIIGNLWKKLYEGGVYPQINNKVDDHAIGLYSDYTGETYCVTVGTAVSAADNPELARKIIPAGRYARFLIRGDMVQAVVAAWSAIWEMDLDRSFTGDFEEYLSPDPVNGEIAIYVALK